MCVDDEVGEAAYGLAFTSVFDGAPYGSDDSDSCDSADVLYGFAEECVDDAGSHGSGEGVAEAFEGWGVPVGDDFVFVVGHDALGASAACGCEGSGSEG